MKNADIVRDIQWIKDRMAEEEERKIAKEEQRKADSKFVRLMLSLSLRLVFWGVVTYSLSTTFMPEANPIAAALFMFWAPPLLYVILREIRGAKS